MKIKDIDTPALLIDRDIMKKNLDDMQENADKYGVKLRPHTKTHKMPKLAKLQVEKGANGIAVAKVDEAVVMAEYGLEDIFIANEIVAIEKLEKIKKLSQEIKISFGIDSIDQVDIIDKTFDSKNPAKVLIEIEIGENRSGVIEEEDFIDLLKHIQTKESIILKGIFSHDGHSYKAKDIDDLKRIYEEGQRRTLKFKDIAEDLNVQLETISIGSTPPFMFDFGVLQGITEIRIGTYIFMDVGQGNAIGNYDRCAATVLSGVISKPTAERVILDVGAKGLTMQKRSTGICKTEGLGYIKNSNGVYIDSVFDEHGIIYNREFNKKVSLGDKVEIIPNHICPVCNLYDKAYLISKGEVVDEIQISARGKIR